MILKKLEIRLMTYGPHEGQHVGTATFGGDAGEVTLNLNQDHIEQLFLVCADGIVDTAKAAARHLTARVIEHRKSLEEPTK